MSRIKNMSIPIDCKMKEDVHYTIGYYVNPPEGSKHKPGDIRGILGCIMFSIDVRPLGGLTQEEVQKIKNFVISRDWIEYFSIGVEGSTELGNLHMHVRIVLREMSNVAKMKKLFKPLLACDRHRSLYDKNGNETKCISMPISACEVKDCSTKTTLMHCAYPLKMGANIGKTRDEIKPDDYNNGIKNWTNIFDAEKDCTDAHRLTWWKEVRFRFHHELHLQQIRQIEKYMKPKHIVSGNGCKVSRDYADEHTIPWSKENYAEILATMITDQTGDVKYTIDFKTFGVTQKTIRYLNTCKLDDDYSTKVQKVLTEALAADAVGREVDAQRYRLKVDNQREIKSLLKQNNDTKKKLEVVVRALHKCKRKRKYLEDVCKNAQTDIEQLKCKLKRKRSDNLELTFELNKLKHVN